MLLAGGSPPLGTRIRFTPARDHVFGTPLGQREAL